jgi:hypothetical protein
MQELRNRMGLRGWWALWALLAIGLAARIAVTALYTPTVFNYYGGDSARYLRLPFTQVTALFGDVAMPAGYPGFLAAIRGIDPWLPLTIAIQHGLGLATAALLYCAVTRAGAPRWAALLPAVVVLLSGDQLFLEHGIFTEALWSPALALALYAMARAISAERNQWWLVLGGALLAGAALVRHVSEFLPALLAIWAALALPGSPSLRIRHAAAVLIPAALVFGSYFVLATKIENGYTGMIENRGFSIYGRVGQFADCGEFTPPPGTRRLCVNTSPTARPGPFFWTYAEESPIRTKMEFDIYDDEDQELLQSFARAAIVHQPLDYAQAAGRDFVRFFLPWIGDPRPDSGTEANDMSFGSTTPIDQGVSLEDQAALFAQVYSGVGDGTTSGTARDLLGSYQSIVRVNGAILFLFLLLGVLGVFLSRGAMRAGASLFLVAGLTLLIVPPLFSSYDVRYIVPPGNLLAASAAFGIAALASRFGSTHPDGMNASGPSRLLRGQGPPEAVSAAR